MPHYGSPIGRTVEGDGKGLLMADQYVTVKMPFAKGLVEDGWTERVGPDED